MKRIIPIFAAALLCVSLTACEGRSNKGFTEVVTSSDDSSAAATKKAEEKPAETSGQETAEAPAETAAQADETAETSADTVAETAPQQETPEPGSPEPDADGGDTADNGGTESAGTIQEALDDAYRTAARSQAQLLLTTCDGLLVSHDITGDPIPDGTYSKGDGSAVAAELDGISDIIDYTVLIADGATISVTVVTQGDNGTTIEETVTV